MLTTVLDTLLDRTVVPGYSRIGYDLRRAWWPADPAPDALAGKVVAVTGANSGLGTATVLGAARLGAEIRMLCRDRTRGEQARDGLRAQLPDTTIRLVECDVSNPASVRAAAEHLRSDCPDLHGLVHNAGVLPPDRTESVDGHELTLATHVIGPHALTALLAPSLAAGDGGRVVFVSSGGMYARRLPIDDLEYRDAPYRGAAAYARTKRAQVILAEQWADHLDGVSVHSMHPGWAATPGLTDSLPGFERVLGPILRTPDQGADTAVWLLAADEPATCSGRFWHDRRPRPVDYLPFTRTSPADADALWQFCVDATGLPRS